MTHMMTTLVQALLSAGDSDHVSEPAGSEAAKFRLWVKSKGLSLTRPEHGHSDNDCQDGAPTLFVPTGTDKNVDGKVQLVFKRVAVVEQFFQIIYNVHVESSSGEGPQLRGRAGKHCGQKRTYRAVADQYAFIPREAISKFLSYCTECQKKQPCITAASLKSPTRLEIDTQRQSVDSFPAGPSSPLHSGDIFDCSSAHVPATPPATPPSDQEKPQLAPHHPQPANYHHNAAVHAMAYAQACHAMQSFISRSLPAQAEKMEECSNEDEERLGGSDIDLSLPITSTYLRKLKCGTGTDTTSTSGWQSSMDTSMEKTETESGQDAPAVSRSTPWSSFTPVTNVSTTTSKASNTLTHLLQQHNGNNNNHTSPVRSEQRDDAVSVADDASSVGNKDEDDDEDEEDTNDENFDGINRDPERLKAFNMFVRLFVDENLDRHVPISKQPKEKIQAIIDSCTRQFPEYSERARKRIRTYLKSCRRTKRSREQAGLDTNNRPTPPHLTSVLAEQLLARACENEAENAKRMRMGMEPVSQSLPSSMITSPCLDTMPSPPQLSLTPSTKIDYKSEQLVNLLSAAQNSAPAAGQLQISAGNGPVISQQSQYGGVASVGLLESVNGQSNDGGAGLRKTPILNHKLNGTEIAAVRQLITGYRESAAFLLRSADELEHLIQIQTKL